ncbi:hypothetical protein DQE82_30440 [Micromonospora sp. LHW51205]|nr:hypothetical protein DQE82_30440 [Micromonospora sp. LHW51205]
MHGGGLLDDQLALFDDVGEIRDDAFIALLKLAADENPEFVVMVANQLIEQGDVAHISDRVRIVIVELLQKIARRPRQLPLFDEDLFRGSAADRGDKE